jgi:hypothetical protein
MSDETKWTYYDFPPLQDLLSLKTLLREVRRRRASIGDVASIEKLIQDRRRNGEWNTGAHRNGQAVRLAPVPI